MNHLLLLISLLCLSQAANLVKLANANPVEIVFWRLFIASVVLGLLLIKKKKIVSELKKFTKMNLFWACSSALILFLHFYFWFMGVHKTLVSNATITFATHPIFTSIFAFILLNERFTKQHFISLMLAISGIIITFYQNYRFNHDQFSGDLLVLLSAALFSGYIVTGKKVRLNISNTGYTFFIYSINSIISAILISFNSNLTFTNYDQKTWLALILMSLFSTMLGHVLFTHSLKHFNINVMSTATLINPLLAIIGAHFLYGEHLTLNATIGFIFTAFGVALLFYNKKIR